MSPYYQTILALCSINIILSVSLNLINGFAGQFSLGHAGFMAIGAYVSATLTTIFVPHASFSSHVVIQTIYFCGVLLCSGVAASFVGFLVGLPSLRLKGDYLAIVTLGFGEIIRVTILNIETVGGARGFIGIPPLSHMVWLIGGAGLTCWWLSRLVSSTSGKQFMAVRDDEVAAAAMGLSTTRIKVKAFVIASFFAGIAGGLFAHYYAYLNPSTFTFNYSFQLIAMVVLGGMGSLSGSVLSALLLTILLEALRPLQELFGMDLRMVIYSLILVVLMLVRPQGIFGHKEIWHFQPFQWLRRFS